MKAKEEKKEGKPEELESVGPGLYKNKSSVKPSMGLFMGNYPMSKAMEWERDCEENFGGVRWIKAWQDHLQAKANKQCRACQCNLLPSEEDLAPQEPPKEEKETKKTVRTLKGDA